MEKSLLPGIPAPPDNSIKNLHTLHYIHRGKPGMEHFYFEGTFKQACDRGRSYCEITGKRFVIVRPFITDFVEEERKFMGVSND